MRSFIRSGKEKPQSSKSDSWFSDYNSFKKYVAAGVVSVMVIIYYLVLYLRVFDLREKNEQ